MVKWWETIRWTAVFFFLTRHDRWVVFFDPSLWRISQSSLRKPGNIDAFTVSWFIRSSSGQLRMKDWYVDECFTAISRIIVCSQPQLHCGFTVLSVFWRFKPWRHLGDPLLGSSWSLQGVPYRCSFHEMSCFVFPLPNRVQKDFWPIGKQQGRTVCFCVRPFGRVWK